MSEKMNFGDAKEGLREVDEKEGKGR